MANGNIKYQDVRRWDRDLMKAAAPDIITNLSDRSMLDMNSSDASRVARGAQRLFWLSKCALSGGLGPVSYDICLRWLLTAARRGSIEARSTIFNIHAALGRPFPPE